MNFQPQPYPLFAAWTDGNKIGTARIVGWSVPEDHDPRGLVPIALVDDSDLSSTEPRYLNLDAGCYWISKDQGWSTSQAREALNDARADQ